MNRRAAPTPRKVPDAVLQAKYRQALARHGKGELDAAETLYREILAQRPENFHAMHMLGVLCAQRDDWTGAESLLAAAVRIDPSVAAAHANLGNTLRLMERSDEAMASYERALRLQPDNTRALKGRGLLLWKSQRREEALASYEHLLQLEPDYADGWIMKGAALNHLGRNDEAIVSYRKALDVGAGANPDKIRYALAALSGEAVPDASPVEYVRDLFDQYARRFEDHLVRQLNYRAPELLVEQLRPLLAPGIDVLDLGCGTGLCGVLLKPWARSLTGLDVSERMLDEARQKEVYDTLVADEISAYLKRQTAGFDLIVAADVFIYIGDLASVFAGAQRALRPDGLFAFSTEVSEGAESRLLESLRYSHSAGYLQRLAAEGGWRVESATRQVLREEERQDVAGHLMVLRRPALP
jgi:predicted TPR repeat methyltransferase